ncbi:MAG: diacylglycerol kinase [Gemmatimonadota bacterium]|nr:MAG: diacylglycerol kinase [Gemmatimonadota bacterium]
MLVCMGGDVYILNPKAGRGSSQSIARDLESRLAAHGLTGSIQVTSGSGDATRLAREAAHAGARWIVAVGGDGTAHEVVNGVAGSDSTFALLPAGTGNDLAMALQIPSDLDEAIAALASSRESRIDLGKFDDRWFVNSLGLGFEAQVTIESTRIHWIRGFAVYLVAVVKALSSLRCPDLVMTVDGRRLEKRRLLVCVGNGPRVGGGFLLTPGATNADGILDVCAVNAMGRWGVLRTLPKAISGVHTDHPKVEMYRGTVIEFESKEGFPFHADGEVIDTERHTLRIELCAGALPVRVPNV